MSGAPEDPADLSTVLEACFEAILDGKAPDLDRLCKGRPELRSRVARVLARQHVVLEAATDAAESSEDRASRSPLGVASEEPATAAKSPSEARRRRLGDFEILNLIGSGGMGSVYRARQLSLDREVALKILRDDLDNSPDARKRLQREAMVTASLDHPNIVPILAAGEQDGTIYVAMKLLPGRALDLHALPLSPRRVAKIGAKVARALQETHQVGVLHRDVKPANVLLDQDQPYLVDFGLARLRNPQSRMTQSNAAPGTLRYMAPESLRERAAVFDPRVDVYGLGATLYETLCGRAPFGGESQLRLLREILYEDPKPLDLKGEHRDLCTIIDRAMQKSPSDRFASAREMAEELDRYLAGEDIESKRIGVFGRAWRRAKRRPRTSAAIAGTILALGALGATVTKMELAERARIASELRAVSNGLDEDSLDDAKRRLRALPTLASSTDLAARIEGEEDLRTLIFALQSRVLDAAKEILAPLAARVRARGTKSFRERIALAAFEARKAGKTQFDLEGELALRFPQCAAIDRAIAEDLDLSAAVKEAPPPRSPLDQLFAGLLLRANNARPKLCERQMRGLQATGVDCAAIHFAHAVTLEHIGEFRAAYLRLAPLLEIELSHNLALCGQARLATLLRYRDSAALLASARERIAEGKRPHEQLVLAMTELQIARDLGKATTFWKVWTRSQPLLERFDAYWLLASDVARDQGESDRARALLTEGLEKVAAPAKAFNLRSVALQLRWHSTGRASETEPLEPGILETESGVIDSIRRDAQSLTHAASEQSRTLPAAECLLVEAQCTRALGQRRRAWELLDRCCEKYATPEAIEHYALLVACRVLYAQISESADIDAEHTLDLHEACVTALERCRAVAVRAERGEGAAKTVMPTIDIAAMATAFHIGDAAEALPRAKDYMRDAAPDEDAFAQLAENCIDWGGLPLDKLILRSNSPEGSAAKLLAAIPAVAESALPKKTKASIYDRWTEAMRNAPKKIGGQIWREARARLKAARALAR